MNCEWFCCFPCQTSAKIQCETTEWTFHDGTTYHIYRSTSSSTSERSKVDYIVDVCFIVIYAYLAKEEGSARTVDRY